ncbi:hypothetical protein M9H77_08782 [Catharanthus roseus]|uniref:Uncharacterized protein n=1 Tax=Catharanthus roseus TaxID=4058 RepID=A0ACC0BZ13_CATRO|nr:hypothetical protein M9H77_08782 [Catharanthus roseus]
MEEKSNPSEDPHSNGGWQTVTYAKKRQKKKNSVAKSSTLADSSKIEENGNVFSSLEKSSEERRRKIIEAQRANPAYIDGYGDGVDAVRASKHRSGIKDDDSNVKHKGNGKVEKKKKNKDKEKPKMTVAEAAVKIDVDDLATYLAELSASYGSQQEVQLMRFADYFGRAFSAVNAAQFPWLKLFRESKVEELADIPLCHIPEAIYKTSADWIEKHSHEVLESFVIWSLNGILADMQQLGSKWHKKGQETSSKSQVAMFLVISMVLRRKPHVLANLLPILRDNSKYHGQEKLPVILWMIVQASQGDLTVGMYLWSHQVLPILGGKSSSNPHTRDLVLQLVERILSTPNAHKNLANNAVKNGQRIVPPSAVDLLLHLTFPAASSQVKSTDRFEAIYPTLIYVALAGSPRSKAMKQLSQQILPIVMKTAGEGIPGLSEEAAKIFIWCLIQSPECYKHWEQIYLNNVKASIIVMRRLIRGWRELSQKLSPHEVLHDTLSSFRQKNEKASNEGADAANRALFKESDTYCKNLLSKIKCLQYGWHIAVSVCVIWMAIGIAIYNFGLKETVDKWYDL